MPTASAKQESKPSSEVPVPIRNVIVSLEHKIRNLEKRKCRLDAVREEQKKGKVLAATQVEAVSKYYGVEHAIEVVQDLVKQLGSASLELLHEMKKQKKKEQLDFKHKERRDFREVLVIQDLLSNLGAENVREDFLTGANGAIQLTEAELAELDEFYKQVTVCREEASNFEKEATAAGDHFHFLLEKKNKLFVAFEYKPLKELLDRIIACGYFDKEPEEDVEEGVEEEVVATEEEEIKEEVVKESAPSSPTEDFEETSVSPVVNSNSNPSDNYFTNQAHFQQAQQPQQNLVTEVISEQSSISFLQDSELDMESPHMDPAVVAARAMVPGQSSLGSLPISRSPPPPRTISPQLVQSSEISSGIPTQTFTNQSLTGLAQPNAGNDQHAPPYQQFRQDLTGPTDGLGASTYRAFTGQQPATFVRDPSPSGQQAVFASQKQANEGRAFVAQSISSETKTLPKDQDDGDWISQYDNTWGNSSNSDGFSSSRGRSNFYGRVPRGGRGRGVSNGYGGRWNSGRGGPRGGNNAAYGGGNYRGGNRGGSSSGGYRGSGAPRGGGYRGFGRGQRDGNIR